MRPDNHWTLVWSIWAVLLLSSEAESEECTVELQVRRNTIYKAFVGQILRVECPVVFCSDPPAVNWYKMEEKHVPLNLSSSNHIIIGWETSAPLTGTSYLVFRDIVSSDAGGYHCQSGGSISHTINITVNEATEVTNTTSKINDTTDEPEPTDSFLMYVISAAGIGSFVIIVVIISVICMQRCKGKSREEKQKENQYIEVSLADQHILNATSSPRGSPNPLPSRRASERKSPGRPAELTPSRGDEQRYGQRRPDRNRQRNAAQVEEPTSVVYAALNHGPPLREAPRPPRETEETEYAAIRLA